MVDDPQHRSKPQEPAPGEQGPSTKTFSIKMASWLTDLAPEGGVEAPVAVEIDAAPAAPAVAAAPPPDTASPFASRPYHLFTPPPSGTPAADPPPSAREVTAPPTTPPVSATASPLAASAVPPIPALAASAVPPIPALAGGARSASPRSTGLVVGVGIALAVVAALGAGWLLWNEQIRALLKI